MSLSECCRNKSAPVLILTAILYLAGWYLRSEKFENLTSLTGFGCVREIVCFSELNQNLLPDNAYIFPEGGYDGQFYYYTAASIFTGENAFYDDADLRTARIGYPLLAGWIYPLLGGRALVVWMTLLPLVFHLISSAVLLYHKKIDLLPALLYAFNPFSLLSFLLNVSDGLALSFAVIGFSLLPAGAGAFRIFGETAKISSRERRRRVILQISGLFFISYSSLIKENFIVLPAGMAAVHLYSYLRNFSSGGPDRNDSRNAVFFWTGSLLPVIIWRFYLSGGIFHSASHADFPFRGMMVYFISEGFSDKAKISLLAVFAAFSIHFLRGFSDFIKQGRAENPYFAAGIFSLGLISLADGMEYWSNFANIARFFAPAVLPAVFIQNGPDRLRWMSNAALLSAVLFLFVWNDYMLLRQNFLS